MYVEKYNKQSTVACPLVGMEVSTVIYMLTRCQDLSSSGFSSHAKLTFSLAFSIPDVLELDCLSQFGGGPFSLAYPGKRLMFSTAKSCRKF